MASSRDIKTRIRSVKNIAQITKALEVVSMNKMRRSQQFALAARPYARASLDMLRSILRYSPEVHLPALVRERKVSTVALIVVTTDKGLVGGFNEAVIRMAEARKDAYLKQGITIQIVTVGKKATDHFTRRKIKNLIHFQDFGNFTRFHETRSVADVLIQGFIKKEWDIVDVVYTHFKTTLKQETVERKLKQFYQGHQTLSFQVIDRFLPEFVHQLQQILRLLQLLRQHFE